MTGSNPPSKSDTIRWDEMTEPQRRLVMALIRAAEASKAAKAEAGQPSR